MLVAVPNVSEGRDDDAIEAIARAFGRQAKLLDLHSDADHHRSVLTLAAEREELVEALVEGAAEAVERIDLRTHDGVHPRVGAVDVVPLVALAAADLPAAADAARAVGERLARELGLPVFLYGAAGDGRRPAFFRRGGLDEVDRRLQARELLPDFGPERLHPTAGAALVGARPPLVAYNVELATDDVGLARAVAAAVRESGGGMVGVQAIGLRLPRSGVVQVSMNVLDLERTPLHTVVARVREEAGRRGVELAGGELVGLLPEAVLRDARAAGAEIAGVDESRVLERRIAASF